jgi:hypothetical protein
MVGWSLVRRLLQFGAIAMALTLGGCVAYPAYPGYGYYNGGYYGSPYYGGGAVAFGGGWGGVARSRPRLAPLKLITDPLGRAAG